MSKSRRLRYQINKMKIKPLVRPTGCEPVSASYKLQGLRWLSYVTHFFGSSSTGVEVYPLLVSSSYLFIYLSQSCNKEKIRKG
jgi:hypothetical protein